MEYKYLKYKQKYLEIPITMQKGGYPLKFLTFPGLCGWYSSEEYVKEFRKGIDEIVNSNTASM